MKVILGIDPGTNGGIAWITDGKPCAEKMPETCLDLWNLIESIRYSSHPQNPDCVAYLESVQPGGMTRDKAALGYRMGSKSAFTFGQGFGHLEMALTAAGIPFVRVRPQAWQKELGCLTGGDKNVSKRRAQELFPSMKITHAIADALLIAEFGHRKERGK